mmetsp:Transcript_17037/g.46833  ORF Transcript_17037/g.46833 Transcript_17037/m.46833 type:complete len:89 (+) Transcript_17037:677-943(+)
MARSRAKSGTHAGDGNDVDGDADLVADLDGEEEEEEDNLSNSRDRRFFPPLILDSLEMKAHRLVFSFDCNFILDEDKDKDNGLDPDSD